MKRPEETAYPTKNNQLESSKRKIEQYIEQNKFSFSCNGIIQTPELEIWLKEWGWKITHMIGDQRDMTDSYYVLREL